MVPIGDTYYYDDEVDEIGDDDDYDDYESEAFWVG